jgi:hypothetical protein
MAARADTTGSFIGTDVFYVVILLIVEAASDTK